MKEMTKIHFGKVLKRLRESKKLSQCRLASRTPFSPSYISLLERDLKRPRIDTIWNLSAGLDMRPSELIREMEEHPENKWLFEQIRNSGPEIFHLLVTCSFCSILF